MTKREVATGTTLLLIVASCCFALLPPDALSSPHWQISGMGTPHERDRSNPVVIEYWAAYTEQTGIKLVWSVYAEKDIDGFRIYRLGEGESTVRVLNKGGLIPAWHQSFVDSDVTSEKRYTYLLGVVFSDGTEFMSTPIDGHASKLKTTAGSRRLQDRHYPK